MKAHGIALAAEAAALRENHAAAAAHVLEVGDVAEYGEDGSRWGIVIYAGRERVVLTCCGPNVRMVRRRREEVRFYRRARESDITSRLRYGSITLEAKRGLRAVLQILRGEPVETLNPNEEDATMAKKTAKKAARAKAPAKTDKKAAPKKTAARAAKGKPKAKAAAPAGGGGRFEHPSLKPGSELRRTFKGREIVVKVTGSGFEYEGEIFSSISALARHITGYMISGPVFFKLATPKAAEAVEKA